MEEAVREVWEKESGNSSRNTAIRNTIRILKSKYSPIDIIKTINSFAVTSESYQEREGISGCNNTLDPFSQDNIPLERLFRITQNNVTYCFDSASLYRMRVIDSKLENPFTRERFNEDVLQRLDEIYPSVKIQIPGSILTVRRFTDLGDVILDVFRRHGDILAALTNKLPLLNKRSLYNEDLKVEYHFHNSDIIELVDIASNDQLEPMLEFLDHKRTSAESYDSLFKYLAKLLVITPATLINGGIDFPFDPSARIIEVIKTFYGLLGGFSKYKYLELVLDNGKPLWEFELRDLALDRFPGDLIRVVERPEGEDISEVDYEYYKYAFFASDREVMNAVKGEVIVSPENAVKLFKEKNITIDELVSYIKYAILNVIPLTESMISESRLTEQDKIDILWECVNQDSVDSARFFINVIYNYKNIAVLLLKQHPLETIPNKEALYFSFNDLVSLENFLAIIDDDPKRIKKAQITKVLTVVAMLDKPLFYLSIRVSLNFTQKITTCRYAASYEAKELIKVLIKVDPTIFLQANSIISKKYFRFFRDKIEALKSIFEQFPSASELLQSLSNEEVNSERFWDSPSIMIEVIKDKRFNRYYKFLEHYIQNGGDFDTGYTGQYAKDNLLDELSNDEIVQLSSNITIYLYALKRGLDVPKPMLTVKGLIVVNSTPYLYEYIDRPLSQKDIENIVFATHWTYQSDIIQERLERSDIVLTRKISPNIIYKIMDYKILCKKIAALLASESGEKYLEEHQFVVYNEDEEKYISCILEEMEKLRSPIDRIQRIVQYTRNDTIWRRFH